MKAGNRRSWPRFIREVFKVFKKCIGKETARGEIHCRVVGICALYLWRHYFKSRSTFLNRSQFVWISYFRLCKKKKIKWSRYKPGVAQRVCRGIALLFRDRGTRRGWVVSSTPRSHFTPWKDPVPILQEAGWDPGQVWTGGKSRPQRDSIPDRPARNSVAVTTGLPGPHFKLCSLRKWDSVVEWQEER